MKNYNLYLKLLIFHLCFILNSAAQGTATATTRTIPHQEQVYMHTSTNLAFVGEYLYYTIYCLNEGNGQLSDLSKIAYVKLVNENKEVVLNHKIRLVAGVGDNSIFIAANIPSGNYKLIAYTQWMLNNGKNYFYDENITVINPYTSSQTVFRPNNGPDTLNVDSRLIENKESIKNVSPNIRLELEKDTYATREMIPLKIMSEDINLTKGNYSVSVRKLDGLQKTLGGAAVDYQKKYPVKTKREHLILPELRGELYKGIVTSSNKGLVGNSAIGISVPGEDYLFKISTTDAMGQFYVNLNQEQEYGATQMYMQVMAANDGGFSIAIAPEEELDLANLKFGKFILDAAMDSVIRKRSIHNQIENAFYSIKPDTIRVAKPNERFYGEATTQYILDDYTRFQSLEETFVEVIEHVWFESNGNEQLEVHVRPISPYLELGKLPLVFVDGLLLTNHSDLLKLSAAQVKSINVSRNQHFYGTKEFQGVIDVTTFKSDFYKNYYLDKLSVYNLFRPNDHKLYYKQSYKGDLKEAYKRIPDFRQQLLWLPNLRLSSSSQTVEFFSSDVKGEYIISLAGFTETGTPVSVGGTFWIE